MFVFCTKGVPICFKGKEIKNAMAFQSTLCMRKLFRKMNHDCHNNYIMSCLDLLSMQTYSIGSDIMKP